MRATFKNILNPRSISCMLTWAMETSIVLSAKITSMTGSWMRLAYLINSKKLSKNLELFLNICLTIFLAHHSSWERTGIKTSSSRICMQWSNLIFLNLILWFQYLCKIISWGQYLKKQNNYECGYTNLFDFIQISRYQHAIHAMAAEQQRSHGAPTPSQAAPHQPSYHHRTAWTAESGFHMLHELHCPG